MTMETDEKVTASEPFERQTTWTLAGMAGCSSPERADALDAWLRIPDGEEGAEAEANTYRTADGYRVDWSLTSVGLVTSVGFGTLAEAHAWLTAEGFTDYTA